MTDLIKLQIDPDKLTDAQFEKLKDFLISVGYYDDPNKVVLPEQNTKKRWPFRWPWTKKGVNK